MTSKEEPTVITLNNENAIQILSQYVELAQQKGAFVLQEAELLKRANDVLINKVSDNELNEVTSINLFIQAINKGQRSGAYTLNDAALLHKVISFLVGQSQQQSVQQQSVQQQSVQQPVKKPELPKRVQNINALDDLSDLAEPIPLRPNVV
jgi:hypothetical protein